MLSHKGETQQAIHARATNLYNWHLTTLKRITRGICWYGHFLSASVQPGYGWGEFKLRKVQAPLHHSSLPCIMFFLEIHLIKGMLIFCLNSEMSNTLLFYYHYQFRGQTSSCVLSIGQLFSKPLCQCTHVRCWRMIMCCNEGSAFPSLPYFIW